MQCMMPAIFYYALWMTHTRKGKKVGLGDNNVEWSGKVTCTNFVQLDFLFHDGGGSQKRF